MAYISLKIKDGEGTLKTLATEIDGTDLIPVHKMHGTVTVNATSDDPVNITGPVTVDNFPATQSVSVQNWPTLSSRMGVTGSVTVGGSVNVGNTVNINPAQVYNSSGSALYIKNDNTTSPLYVYAPPTGFYIKNSPSESVYIKTYGSDTVSVTSTYTSPIQQQTARGTSISEYFSSSFNWSTEASGTFALAPVNASRRELIICNNSNNPLYVKISSTTPTTFPTLNFTLTNTASAPTNYNFVVFPSGTFMTSEASRTMYYSGYFVSSSNVGAVSITSIS